MGGGPAWACTNFLITKGASVDGSTMITYTADAHVLYGELYHWPAASYLPGAMLDVFPKNVPLMVSEENTPFFFNFFLNLQLGKRR